MTFLISSVALLGPLMALAGGLLLVVRIVALVGAATPASRVLRHVAVALGLAAVAFVVAGLAGVWVFCHGAGAGDLCGLGGVLGTGPLAAGLSLILMDRRLRRELDEDGAA